MDINPRLKYHHLLWRAGFGPALEEEPIIPAFNPRQGFDALVRDSGKTPEYINVAKNEFDGVVKGFQDIGKLENLSKEQKQAIRKQSREDLKSLNLRWLDEMIYSEAQLREKMAFFWHGHFASRSINIYYQQLLLDIIRHNALGDFGTLLREVSKSASMLAFLNNQQNRKQHPNENFAREVMELFTMGRGNYTETDIQEAARAFTGWGFTLDGEFAFRRQWHDAGVKTVLGQTGNYDGDDILDIILNNKKTALFITRKIFKYFVHSDVDEARVEWLAGRFYQSGYSIMKLLEDIYTSEWFYDTKYIGRKIKSPVELLTGIRRAISIELPNPEIQLLFQKVLGQVLFYPPNVAGWPGGKSWIDSSTLMVRLRLPQLLAGWDELNFRPKDDDDQQMGVMEMMNGSPGKEKNGMANRRRMKPVNGASMDWDPYLKKFETMPKLDLLNGIMGILLQTELSDKGIITRHADISGRDNFIKSASVAIMSTPEYQMC